MTITSTMQIIWTSHPLEYLAQFTNVGNTLYHADIIRLDQNFICSPAVIFIEQILDQIIF